MVIVLDLDGTVVDNTEYFRTTSCKVLQETGITHRDGRSVDELTGEETWKLVKAVGLYDYVSRLMGSEYVWKPLMPGATEFVQKAISLGHTIHVVTARAKSYMGSQEILETFLFVSRVLKINGSCLVACRDKTPMLKYLACDWFIDDNIAQVDAAVDAGFKTIQMQSPDSREKRTTKCSICSDFYQISSIILGD
ncbi:MAG: hypothetical protein RSC43_00175 [Clostridia bacterium]